MEEILDEELNTSKTELQRSKGEKERDRVSERDNILYYIYTPLEAIITKHSTVCGQGHLVRERERERERGGGGGS